MWLKYNIISYRLFNATGTGKTPKSRRSCSGITRCRRWKRLYFGSSTLPGTAVRNIYGRPPTTFIGSSTCFWTSCCWCYSWSYWWCGLPKKCFVACSAGVVVVAEMLPRRQQRGKKHSDMTMSTAQYAVDYRSARSSKRKKIELVIKNVSVKKKKSIYIYIL